MSCLDTLSSVRMVEIYIPAAPHGLCKTLSILTRLYPLHSLALELVRTRSIQISEGAVVGMSGWMAIKRQRYVAVDLNHDVFHANEGDPQSVPLDMHLEPWTLQK